MFWQLLRICFVVVNLCSNTSWCTQTNRTCLNILIFRFSIWQEMLASLWCIFLFNTFNASFTLHNNALHLCQYILIDGNRSTTDQVETFQLDTEKGWGCHSTSWSHFHLHIGNCFSVCCPFFYLSLQLEWNVKRLRLVSLRFSSTLIRFSSIPPFYLFAERWLRRSCCSMSLLTPPSFSNVDN